MEPTVELAVKYKESVNYECFIEIDRKVLESMTRDDLRKYLEYRIHNEDSAFCYGSLQMGEPTISIYRISKPI